MSGPSIRVQIATDYYPRELSWDLVYQPPPTKQQVVPVEQGGPITYQDVYPEPIVVDQIATGELWKESTLYEYTYSIADIEDDDTTTEENSGAGMYALIIKDSAGDGICCNHGKGYIRILQLDPVESDSAGAPNNNNAVRETELAAFYGSFLETYVMEFTPQMLTVANDVAVGDPANGAP